MDKKDLTTFVNDRKAQAIISMSEQTRVWYSSVQTSDGILVIETEKAYLFVDGRYTEYAQKNAENVEVLDIRDFSKFLEKKQYQAVLLEKDYLKINDYEKLNQLLMKANEKVTKIFINGQELRIKKDAEELKKISKACDISLQAYKKVRSQLKVGVTENEIAALMTYEMKLLGADKESFDPIVAFGPSSAEPHHHPTKRKLKDGDIVKLDFGALYKGYSADITRTFFFGTAKADKKELKKILKIVEEAADLGIKAVKPGAYTDEIDKLVRDYIVAQGYGDKFVHSLGHGLGVDVHELPNLSRVSRVKLEPGMVITVEPGIYLEGLGGARIENDILVTEKGYRVLSKEKK